VIPARGGSKRIPGKNIREFAGKPIIGYSIECALRSGLFDRVIVSTDDQEISRVARALGAEVPFERPAEFSGDHADTAGVIAHATGFLQASGVDPSAVCCIYATAPFVREQDLRSGLAILETGAWQFVFSATTFAAPIHRSFWENAQGGLEMFFPEYSATRSQDLPEAMHDAGQFYWGRAQAWLDRIKIFDKHSTVVKIPRWRALDIDTEEDWAQAETMMSGFLSSNALNRQ
jgi:N-acylneuraminate cytidylyltransferase